MNSSFRSKLKGGLGLYMVTTVFRGRSHSDIALAAIKGGASIIQYRDKDASSRTLFETAQELRNLTSKTGVKLIINDRVDIALAVGADGVHLGQDDLSLSAARRILGDDYVIGISATNYGEAIAASREGADYIGLGPIYPTPSKHDAAPPMGLVGMARVAAAVSVPIVAIGGITADNVGEVIRGGADGAAVISAVTNAEDMAGAAHILCEMIEQAKKQRNE